MRITIFDRAAHYLVGLMNLGRDGGLPVSVQSSKKGYVVRVGRHIRVSGQSIDECWDKLKAAIDQAKMEIKA